MSNGIFIASTGTDIGKTFVTCALLHQMFRAGIKAEAIKPIASGVTAGDAYSDPACLLRAMGKPHHLTAINEICPWRYEKAIAANLAAANEGEVIDWTDLVQFCKQRLARPQLTLIEGAGGLMSPITDTRFVLDLISELRTPTLLVVGNYLGSISHTLTAMETLKSHRIPLLGLVVSESIEPAIDQQQMEQLIFNRQKESLPLVWIPRNRDKPEAYKFAPSLEPLWMNHQNF